MITAKIKSVPKAKAEFKDLIITSGTETQYDGQYTVVPKANSGTVLFTKDKVLSENIQVLEIPYFEVSNETGNTVYIGGESEIV